MERSIWAVVFGTFTLRFSTGLTGSMLTFYLADLPRYGGENVSSIAVGILTAAFFAAELGLSPVLGALADRWGFHRVMELGPAFGLIAATLTGLTVSLWLLGGTRILSGASAAASIPSILGFIALATAMDEGLRGRAVARFEAATLAGFGAGIVAGGVLYGPLGAAAFYLNAGFYCVSWAIYRFGVSDPRADARGMVATRQHTTMARYAEILRGSHVWLLAPTWIAVNAALGTWTSQTLFQLVRTPPPQFRDQFLMQGYPPIAISAGLLVIGLIFGTGLVYWGNRFRRFRRTTIVYFGLAGGAVVVAGALGVNHGTGLGVAPLLVLGGVVGAGVFVLAGATPAALGLLADMTEAFPQDRGAIMGLYSVLLALGQIGGSLISAAAAEAAGIDGLLWTTLGFVGIALLPLWRLRAYEHRVGDVQPAGAGGTAP